MQSSKQARDEWNGMYCLKYALYQSPSLRNWADEKYQLEQLQNHERVHSFYNNIWILLLLFHADSIFGSKPIQGGCFCRKRIGILDWILPWKRHPHNQCSEACSQVTHAQRRYSIYCYARDSLPQDPQAKTAFPWFKWSISLSTHFFVCAKFSLCWKKGTKDHEV